MGFSSTLASGVFFFCTEWSEKQKWWSEQQLCVNDRGQRRELTATLWRMTALETRVTFLCLWWAEPVDHVRWTFPFVIYHLFFATKINGQDAKQISGCSKFFYPMSFYILTYIVTYGIITYHIVTYLIVSWYTV